MLSNIFFFFFFFLLLLFPCSSLFSSLSLSLSLSLVSVTGSLEVNMGIRADIQAKFQKQFTWAIVPQQFVGSVTIPLGPVPLLLDAYLALYVKGSLKAEASGLATAGFKYTKQMTMGMQYKSGRFNILRSSGGSFRKDSPKVDVSGKADISLSLLPKLTIKLAKLLPVEVTPTGTVGVAVKIGRGSGCKNVLSPHYQVYKYFGIDVKVGGKISFLGFKFSLGPYGPYTYVKFIIIFFQYVQYVLVLTLLRITFIFTPSFVQVSNRSKK